MILTKDQIMKMTAEDLGRVIEIIGELGTLGYRISLYRMQGNSLQQCAQKFSTTRETVRYYWGKCVEKEHDKTLTRIFAFEKKETFVPVKEPNQSNAASTELHRNKKFS
jgi:hypothetical protein